MPEISQEDLNKFNAQAETLTSLTETVKRIEGENAKVKTRAQDAESKLTDFEKEKVENDGDIQKRLDMEITENGSLKTQILDYKTKTMDSKLRSKIAESFPNVQKGGIDLMLQVKEHKGLLKIDSEAETIEGIKEFGEAVSKTHPFLFSKKTIIPTDDLPPGKAPLEDENLTDDQKYAKELGSAKNQTEYDNVRKKWKRF